jgi:signal transduction histidine kinase
MIQSKEQAGSPLEHPESAPEATVATPETDRPRQDTALLDAMPLGLFILDRQGLFVYLNSHAERFFEQVANRRRDQMLGQPIWQVCPEVADSPFIREYARAFAEQRDFDLEVYYPTLGRWFAIRAAVAEDCTPFFLQDISHRVNLERAARQHAGELADAARAHEEGLLRVAQRLRRALRPLRKALRLLKDQGDTDREIRQDCARGQREVQSLCRYVRRLLGLGRAASGQVRPGTERSEVPPLAAREQGARPARREGRGRRVTVTLPSEALEVADDPQLLQGARARLLNDALRFTAPGGRIWLTAARHEGRVEVSVRDNGVGVSPELLPRIVDLLVRLEKSEPEA